MLPMDFCNVYTPGERPVRAMALLEEVEMTDQAYKLPSALSGGQQQRVAIARALALDPPILLADEPTGNLDSERSREVMQLLVELNARSGITIIMVTHDANMAAYARRVIRFIDGRICGDAAQAARGSGAGAAASLAAGAA
jgi:putative ABC transport system ATP-binding protein